ncbi:MAG: electron transfer flavoprotein subunit beta/FixA family protein [Deltaproteobacteria bacterium]|nr:electron transfer flavoprotein subunit beta/FixA family protein [Deltaproteobacteria bacterium]
MLKIVVCIKQVPMVSELPWNPKTGTLKRELADGMMNPACAHALEAALQIKSRHGAEITAVTMGPPMAEEVLYEALAMGADEGILLSDPAMAGGDTWATSYTLSRTIEKQCPDYDLVLCGCFTSDSETSQVGPQLAEELEIPGASNVEEFEIEGRKVRMQRVSDNFLEIMEMKMPGLMTVMTHSYVPRYPTLGGMDEAFEHPHIKFFKAKDLGLDKKSIGRKGSPTRIIKVYSPTADKKNVVLKGTAKKVVDEIFAEYGDKISGVIGKDLKNI